MTATELQHLQANGNEIGSHSVSHSAFTYLTEQQIRYECSYSKQVLQSYGLTVNNFAYPYGDRNDYTDSIASQYYRSIRSAYAEPYIMSLPTSQVLLTGYPGETGDPSSWSQFDALQAAEYEVEQVANNGGWVIIFFHNIGERYDYSYPYGIAADYFEDFLEYVQASDVSVLTVNQALNIAGPSLSATISPTAVNLNPGGSQQFTSNVIGGVSPYTYQWYLNNSAVLGATSPTWTFNPTVIGTYRIYVQVADSYTSTTLSNTATVRVTLPLTTIISPTPVSLTIGNTQQFTSTTTGGLTPYTYQWYYTNNTAIIGATTSTLNYKANYTGTYNIYLNVTDNLNYKVKSNTATLNIYTQPTVTISPTPVSLTIGNTQQFTSTTTGGLTPYTYQWYYTNNTAIIGATTSTLNYKANYTGTYNIYLNVTDNLNYKVKSNTATLNIYTQPSVTISPTPVSLTIGNTQQFTSTTTGGLTPYTYQWYYTNNTAIIGATTSTLNYKANYTGTYNIYLNVTDNLNYKVKSNTATLNIYTQPTVTISPTPVSLTIGNTQQFTSTTTGGLTPYTYQWYYTNNTAIIGATTSTLNYKANYTGTYNIYLNVTDNLNYKAKSNFVTLDVYSQPTVLITPTKAILYYGQSQTFSASTSGGLAPYTYQWYINNTAVPQATYPDWTFMPRVNGNYQIHLNVTDSLGSEVKSNIANEINVYSVHLMIDSQACYSSGEQVSLKVTVLNQQNPQLESTLALTITGPAGYSFYDFQPINVSANTVNEYSFNWIVPNFDGTYVIEASLVPTQLTTYDAKWVQVSDLSTGSEDSNTNSVVVSSNLVNSVLVVFALVEARLQAALVLYYSVDINVVLEVG